MSRRILVIFICIFSLCFCYRASSSPYTQIFKDGNLEKIYQTGTQADWDSILAYFEAVDIDTQSFAVEVTGIYELTNPIYWTKSGSELYPIKIKGALPDQASGFYGSYMDTTSDSSLRLPSSPAFWFQDKEFITIENLYFFNFSDLDSTISSWEDCSKWDFRQAIHLHRSSHIRISNCLFEDMLGHCPVGAIGIHGGIENIVEFCTFKSLDTSNRYLHAVYLISECIGDTIRDNYITYCSGDPFRVRDGSNYNQFIGNIVDTCGSSSYYGSWFKTDSEAPCIGNMVKNTNCNQPDPEAETSSKYFSNSNYIRKFHDINDFSVYETSPDSAFISSDFFDPAMPFYMPEVDHNNIFFTIDPQLNIHKDPVIGEDPAFFGFDEGEGIYKSHVYLNGFAQLFTQITYADPTKFYLNDVGDTIWTDVSTVQRIKIDLIDEENHLKPRIFDRPVYLRTVQGDTIDYMLLERWIVQPDSGEKVLLIDGADQRIEFNLTDLAQDYDIFLLPGELHETVLWYLQNDPEQGWEYFNFNAIEKSIKSGTEEEIFYAILQDEEQYCFVVSEKPDSDREKSSQYWIRIIPIEKKSPK